MKPTLEELKALYPAEEYSTYDLYYGLHLTELNKNLKKNYYHKKKEKILEQIKEVKEEIKNPPPPPQPESQYPPIIKDTKTKKQKN